MIALVDCNNFYASCERVFRPDLIGKPVVVLSNNDGCVIARSNEVKSLGIKMGVPAFEIKELISKHNIAVFSSNYTLYGDMSSRVMSMLQEYVKELEVYSIDEAFLSFYGYEHYNLKEYGTSITQAVTQGTGIPVSMGIAPTKTLAKVANKFAKKFPKYNNVCLIDTDEKRIKALQLTKVGDVWGIGRQHAKKLVQMGVKTAYDFTQLPQAWVRKYMTVVGERMYKELLGTPCIELEMEQPDKKQICTSRSFGKMVEDYDSMKESVATYASICSEKLRKQHSCAVSLMVFVHTNHFREDLPQYARNTLITLPTPTSSTLEVVHHALRGLKDIYREGYKYKKAGVIITEIVPDSAVQQNLFDTTDRSMHAKLMEVIDIVNSGFTRNMLTLAVQGVKQDWKLKQERLSPCYTTKLNDVIKVR